MKTDKQLYWILSGKGSYGTWVRKLITLKGVKRILARARKDGLWACAFGDVYLDEDGHFVGVDVETGSHRLVGLDSMR